MAEIAERAARAARAAIIVRAARAETTPKVKPNPVNKVPPLL